MPNGADVPVGSTATAAASRRSALLPFPAVAQAGAPSLASGLRRLWPGSPGRSTRLLGTSHVARDPHAGSGNRAAYARSPAARSAARSTAMTGAIALARASQARKSTGGLHGRALTWALLVHAGL